MIAIYEVHDSSQIHIQADCNLHNEKYIKTREINEEVMIAALMGNFLCFVFHKCHK